MKDLYQFLKDNVTYDFLICRNSCFSKSITCINGESFLTQVSSYNSDSYQFIDGKLVSSSFDADTFKNDFPQFLEVFNKSKIDAFDKDDYFNRFNLLPFYLPSNIADFTSEYVIPDTNSFIYSFIKDVITEITNFSYITSYKISYKFKKTDSACLFSNGISFSYLEEYSHYIRFDAFIEDGISNTTVSRFIHFDQFPSLDVHSFISELEKEGLAKLKVGDFIDGTYSVVFRNDVVIKFFSDGLFTYFDEKPTSLNSNSLDFRLLNPNKLVTHSNLSVYYNLAKFKPLFLSDLHNPWFPNLTFTVFDKGVFKPKIELPFNSIEHLNEIKDLTFSSLSHITILPSDKSFIDLVRKLKNGFIITKIYTFTDFEGGRDDDGSYYLLGEGFYLKDGEVVCFKPIMIRVKEMEFIKNIKEIGNDVYTNRDGSAPSLLVDGIEVYHLDSLLF